MRSGLALGVVGTLGAAVLAFSAPEAATDDALVAVGSTSNNANPSCNGKKNSSCTPDTDGPVKDFGLTVGAMTGIYPTGSKHVPLTFSNPHNFDIVVKTVAVEVFDANDDCSQVHLTRPAEAVTLRSQVIVPKNGVADGPAPTSADGQTLRVTMLNTVPNVCQGVSYPITVTAMAEKR